MNNINCLAFGAHPDDVELFCSGLLIKLNKQGYSTGVVDLTKGELSTNGTIESRQIEAEKAAGILKINVRRNLGLPDGNLENNENNRLEIIKVIREFRPDIVLLPYWDDRHPDHVAASKLVSDSCYYSGLKKIETSFPEFRPKTKLYFMMNREVKPSFVVDISNEMDLKLESIKSYQTQFFKNKNKILPTYINRANFLDKVIDRAKYYGHKIQTKYAEPYYFDESLKINNIMDIFS